MLKSLNYTFFCICLLAEIFSASDLSAQQKNEKLSWQKKTVLEWITVLETPVTPRTLENRDHWYAAYALGLYAEQAQPAVQALITRMNTLRVRDDYVRSACARALGKIRDPQALPHLIAALNSDYLAIQRNAVWALGQFNLQNLPQEKDKIAEAVTPLLKHEDPTVCANAAVTLYRHTREKEALKTLANMLASTRSSMMYAGAVGCLELGPDARPLVKTLINRLSAKDQDVSRACTDALIRIGDAVYPYLNDALNSDKPSVRSRTLCIYGNILPGDARVVVPLYQALRDQQAPAVVRIAALRGLIIHFPHISDSPKEARNTTPHQIKSEQSIPNNSPHESQNPEKNITENSNIKNTSPPVNESGKTSENNAGNSNTIIENETLILTQEIIHRAIVELVKEKNCDPDLEREAVSAMKILEKSGTSGK